MLKLALSPRHGHPSNLPSACRKHSKPLRPTRRRIRRKVCSYVCSHYLHCANASLVVVRFKAVGNAPIMKQNLYKITATNRFQAVIQFLRKELGWKAGDPLVRVPCYLRVRCILTRVGAMVVHVHQPRVRTRPGRHRVEPVQGIRLPVHCLRLTADHFRAVICYRGASNSEL